MKRFSFFAVLAVMLVVACTKSEPKVPVYVWEGIGENTDMTALQGQMRFWKEQGVTGVCINNRDPELVRQASALAHKEGLEYHAWIPVVVRGDQPHEWYAVNRLGQNAQDSPAYVDYYKVLDPHNPQVHKYLVEEMTAIASIPDVDYVQLDYIRYPDVILARGLWDKYGLTMDHEYAPADYCYCPDCVADFKARSGIDILSVEDPETVPEWAQFRCDAVTALVNEICEAVHKVGKKVSADVFPGPDSHAKWMVRQDWGKWDVDMLFPMNYNDFYLEPASWLRPIVEEEVASAGDTPVMSGLFICPDWQNKDKVEDPENSGLLPSEMAEAVKGSMEAGAAGICLFTLGRMSPEHWAALKEALARKTTSLPVMSFNVRLGVAKDGENSWEKRKEAAVAMLLDQRPAVFGVQEAYDFQLDYFKESCPGYEWVGVGREDGVSEGEHMSVFYDKDRMELKDWGTYWLSETPDIPSKGWDAACFRTATWTLLHDKKANKDFYFVNTHLDHVGVEARRNGLMLLVERIGQMNPDGLPMILCGDFNVFPDNPGLTDLRALMADSRETALASDNGFTYHGWGTVQDSQPIDYVFYKGFKECRSFTRITTPYKGRPFVSDHYPVVSVLEY